MADGEELLITEFIKELSPLLPNPCHFQNYDQSMSQHNARCARSALEEEEEPGTAGERGLISLISI